MNCPGCAASLDLQNRERDLATLKTRAKAYATEKDKTVVLYFDPLLGYGFMESEAAKAAGIVPLEYILPA